MPKKKPSQAYQPIPFRLRTETGYDAEFKSREELQEEAYKWTYLLRGRRRWVDDDSVRAGQIEESRAVLKRLGIGDKDLEQMAQAEIIEVSIPFEDEKTGWELRIFPWEYVLSAATKLFRAERSPLVVRRLDCAGKTVKRSLSEKLLVVKSTPASLPNHPLKDVLDLESKLVELHWLENKAFVSDDDALPILRDRIEDIKPQFVHIAGFDTRQADALGLRKRPEEENSGFLMTGEFGELAVADSHELGRLLTAADSKPELVFCGFFNSAARMCPMIVIAGAGAAVGFQDEFDKNFIHSFAADLYSALQSRLSTLLQAFVFAWKQMKARRTDLRGTGIVLWSRDSLIPSEKGSLPKAFKLIRQGVEARNKSIIAPDGDQPTDTLRVEIEPIEHLNYSMLHNNRGLFETFLLRKLRPGQAADITVEVELYSGGSDRFQFRKTINLTEPVRDLRDEIRVPLLYALGPTPTESARSSLYVRVTWSGLRLHEDTRPVTLLPIDEWRDDEEDRIWLPSFVLPRDPAVGRVVEAAQRYLTALLDDGIAAFDGYQSIGAKSTDPTENVDMQARALWAALTFDMALAYVNPPPSYSMNSQRLRTPSEILETRRGTCIDLALMFASCLEYVDIYPVIILIEGHAFPAYWRDFEAHGDFLTFKTPKPRNDGFKRLLDEPIPVQPVPWYFGPDAYEGVAEQVRLGNLVPLETVHLTERGGFWSAVEEGKRKLRKDVFHALIDIVTARKNAVTPIPMRWRTQ